MNKHQVSTIENALNHANGKRRERTASLDEVLDVVTRVEAGEAFVAALRGGVEYEAARAVWAARLAELDGRAPRG